VNTADLIWMNGEFVSWEDAKVHVLSHALHYATASSRGSARTRTDARDRDLPPRDHLARLEASPGCTTMDLPYTTAELREATHELIGRNRLSSCYIRPPSTAGTGRWAESAGQTPSRPRSPCGSGAPTSARRARPTGSAPRWSSWRRSPPSRDPPRQGQRRQYLNSVLAKIESLKAGYDEAILLDRRQPRLRGSGENVFVVKDGTICTPPQTAGILDGINRASGDADRGRSRPSGGGAGHRPFRVGAGGRGVPHRHGRGADAGA